MKNFNFLDLDNCVFLEGKITYLRPLLKSDIRPQYLSWLNNPKLTIYSSHFRSWPTTENDLELFFSNLKKINSIVFALCCKETGVHFGNASIDEIDWINRNAHFNIMIGIEKYRVLHYLDVMDVLTKYTFNTLNLNKLCGGTEIPQLPSLHERMGWKIEGVFKDHNFRDGNYVDVVRVAIFKDDYLKTKSK
jgi:RimJ/RimL family protein N-acetyltransferase